MPIFLEDPLENSANEDINNKNTNSDIDGKASEIKSDVVEGAKENIPIDKPQSEIEQIETVVISNELIPEFPRECNYY